MEYISRDGGYSTKSPKGEINVDIRIRSCRAKDGEMKHYNMRESRETQRKCEGEDMGNITSCGIMEEIMKRSKKRTN